jgi:catechol 2,3-dioxygenase-like lactoylglutathione lyase family enzyme
MSQFFGTNPVLPVLDVRTAVAYYCDLLGFTFDALTDDDPPTHGSVTRDRVGIQFTHVRDGMPPYGEWTYIFVTDLDRLVADYRATGVTITVPPASHAYGMREFEIVDLHGYRLRFGQYLTE